MPCALRPASQPIVAAIDATGRFHLKTQICGFCGKITSEPAFPPSNTFLQLRAPRVDGCRRPHALQCNIVPTMARCLTLLAASCSHANSLLGSCSTGCMAPALPKEPPAPEIKDSNASLLYAEQAVQTSD